MTLLAAHEDAPAARLRLALDAVLVVKPNARVNSKEARRRADNLQARLQKRMERLDLEKHISALPPVVLGGLIVVPTELLAEMTGTAMPAALQGGDKQASAVRARAAVMEVERALGFDPTDREFERLGYDIESADTVTVTRNEILYSLNKPEEFILAIVEFIDGESHRVHYVRRPFQKDPNFGVTSVNYDLGELIARGEEPG